MNEHAERFIADAAAWETIDEGGRPFDPVKTPFTIADPLDNLGARAPRIFILGDRTFGVRHNGPGDHPVGHAFKNAKAGEAWAEDHFAEWKQGLSPGTSAALEDLKDKGFSDINFGLRHGGLKDLDAEQKKTFLRASQAFGKQSAAIDRDIVVYRGGTIPGITDRLADVQAGEVFSDKGFVSTTMNTAIAREFADKTPGAAIIQIHAPQGTKMVYMEPFTQLEHSESELLLKPNTKFKVLRTGSKDGQDVVVVEVQP